MEEGSIEFEHYGGMDRGAFHNELEPLLHAIEIRSSDDLPCDLVAGFSDVERELLQAIWAIMISIVDIGFGVHPVQAALLSAGSSDEEQICQ